MGAVQKTPVVDIVTVTRNTRTIDGVKTLEVRDQVFEAGVITEDTLDWYGQDDQGNVWYFGELATELPAGTHTGSWTAGVSGAQPGHIMEAAPKVGTSTARKMPRASRRTRPRCSASGHPDPFHSGASQGTFCRRRTTRC